MLLNIALNQLRERVLNPALTRYGTITSLSYRNNRLCCTVRLLGLESTELMATCSRIRVFERENAIELSDFHANKAFLENILNTFATKKFVLPKTFFTQAILKVLKMIL